MKFFILQISRRNWNKSLLTCISAYFIDFVIFISNIHFKEIIYPKVLLNDEIKNSGTREYNSLMRN